MFQSYGNIIKRMSGGGGGGVQPEEDSLVEPGREAQEQEASKKHESASTEYLVHNWLEAIFAYFQVVVLWHEPQTSIRAISALLSLFLLLTHFAPRFYAVVFLAVFLSNLNKFWFRHVWPEIRVPPGGDREEEMRLDVDRFTYLHPQLMTLKELKDHIKNLIRLGEGYLEALLELRRQKPTQFCLRICFILSSTAYLGQIISGLTIVFSALVIIMSAPGIYAHLLPEEHKLCLKKRYQSLVFPGQLVDESQGEGQAQETHQEPSGNQSEMSEKSTSAMGHLSKEAIASSMATTMRSIESLFGNLRKKSSDAIATTSETETESETTTFQSEHSQKQQHQSQSEIHPSPHSGANVLTNLREDGAKVLYNLIDVTLMGSGAKVSRQTKRTDSTGSHQSDRPDDSGTTESISLLSDKDEVEGQEVEEEEQQDDGFVML